MNKNKQGYADITKMQGIQIALVQRILDEKIPPHKLSDGWQIWEFGTNENREPAAEKQQVREFKRRC